MLAIQHHSSSASTIHQPFNVDLCCSLSLGVLLGGIGNVKAWIEEWSVKHYNSIYGMPIPGFWVCSLCSENRTVHKRMLIQRDILGGNDCFSLSAFSASFKTSVYRCRWQRTLNLICEEPLVRFIRAAACPSVSVFQIIFSAASSLCTPSQHRRCLNRQIISQLERTYMKHPCVLQFR